MTNKEFVKEHLPFKELKKVGMFDKSIKGTDYDAIVKRFEEWYGDTKEHWVENLPYISPQFYPGIITGHGRYSVGPNGELQTNGFLITIAK